LAAFLKIFLIIHDFIVTKKSILSSSLNNQQHSNFTTKDTKERLKKFVSRIT